jgi:hypothetical protein
MRGRGRDRLAGGAAIAAAQDRNDVIGWSHVPLDSSINGEENLRINIVVPAAWAIYLPRPRRAPT